MSSNYNIIDKSDNTYNMYEVNFNDGKSCIYFNINNAKITDIVIAKKNSFNSFKGHQLVLYINNMEDLEYYKNCLTMLFNELKDRKLDVRTLHFNIYVDNNIDLDNSNKLLEDYKVEFNIIKSSKYIEISKNDTLIEKNKDTIDKDKKDVYIENIDKKDIYIENMNIDKEKNIEQDVSKSVDTKIDSNKKVKDITNKKVNVSDSDIVNSINKKKLDELYNKKDKKINKNKSNKVDKKSNTLLNIISIVLFVLSLLFLIGAVILLVLTRM